MPIKLFFLVLIFLSSPTFIFAESFEYHSLAPIEGFVDTTETIDENSFGTYLDNMFRLGIALCTALAVLMLIIGGIQYVSTDAWGKKSEGKERIFAALFGLVIALGSYALLRTINPAILDTNLELRTLDIDYIKSAEHYLATGEVQNPEQPPLQPGENPTASSTPQTPGKPGVAPSGKFADIPGDISVQAKGGQVDSSMIPGLQGMAKDLSAQGIQWTVTEGYPPSRAHKNPCHQNGTCIDADFFGQPDTADNIKKFVNSANNNGFRAVFETDDKKQYDSLVASGVPSNNIQYIPPGWISGTHFSVYNRK